MYTVQWLTYTPARDTEARGQEKGFECMRDDTQACGMENNSIVCLMEEGEEGECAKVKIK